MGEGREGVCSGVVPAFPAPPPVLKLLSTEPDIEILVNSFSSFLGFSTLWDVD